MHKASPEETMMMMKMQKDAELDKKIEGLRKKNEALMKRYQEVEEDKKRAEQEGMSLHIRKMKHDDLTITLSKSSNEQRVVTKKAVPKGSNTSDTRSDQEKDPCDPGTRSNLGIGRGKRRQLLITTPGNIKDKRVFVERKDINRPVSPARAKPSPEEEQDALESTTQVKRPPSTKKTVKMQEDTCKQDVKDRCEESQSDQKTTEVSSLLGVSDLNPLTSREEQTEYLRWKKEREEIDRERVARHRNAKGQWKRAWDVEKPDLMYSDKHHEEADRDTHNNTGIRNGRRGNLRSEESRARERKGKSLPVVSSKAKGKERLTGRARRWNAKDHEEHLQVYSESGLQAFLEELDALCSSEENNINPETKKQDNASNTKPFVSEVPLKPEEAIGDVTSYRENGNISAGTDDVKISEKKVRFLEELHETAHKISNSIAAETKGSCPVQNGSVVDDKEATESQNGDDCLAEDKEKVLSETLAGTERKISELSLITEGNEEESREASCPSSGHGGDVYRSAEADQTRPVEVTKTCSEEVMDSSLSVLNLDSGETRSDCSSSTDMARENGKVV